ncbi:hypothetical protein [Burkholderia ambifaria]|uniref:hypothetical protein n=1 Tax=Burkholderia ambifaria TaxID=152480 RepID=UPI001FC8C0B0|nr:hypothetical protein [Burkholderia ambifaria]WAS56364.1 hypothetical protein MK974_25050 [Burkholderia ambifaria]WDR86282.1 hypothetical protein OR986_07720 [Burkholderia ambifaria]WDR98927.1 hypothetical protein OR985_12680 [Burkholderia ambifaria]
MRCRSAHAADRVAAVDCTAFLYPRTGKPFPWEFLVDDRVERRQIDPFIATNDIDAELDVVLSGAAIGQFFGYSVTSMSAKGGSCRC